MSFPHFLPPSEEDFPEEDHPADQHQFSSFSPRPSRPHQPGQPAGLPDTSLSHYPSRSSQHWSPANVNYTSDMFFQGDPSSPYYALSSELNNSNISAAAYAESSQHAYMHPPAQSVKLDTPTSHPPSLYSRLQASNFVPYPTSQGFMGDSDVPYHSHEQYHPENNHAMLHTADSLPYSSSTGVKDEPFTPTSPQFIFEFPGGEDEPPPFELPSASVFPDHSSSSQVPTCDSPALEGSCSTSRTRPGSPTTEAMKSMMSVFRVDPFASYDADSGTRRKRRKRGSTYARTTDPEASSKEEPLMFTFQLEVAPPEWATDELEADPLENEYASLHDWQDQPDIQSPDHKEDLDYAVFDDNVEVYRIQHSAFESAPDTSGISRISRAAALSMPVPLPGTGPSTSLFADEHTESPETSLPLPIETMYTAEGTSVVSASEEANTSAGLTYPSSHSRQSSIARSLLGADSDTYEEAVDVPPSSVSLVLEGATANSVPVLINKRSRLRPTKMHICWICHKEFPRPSGLATHMNTHSGAKRSSYTIHNLLMFLIHFVIRCYFILFRLDNHISPHFIAYKCPVPACSKMFAVRSNARRHLRTHGTLFESLVPFRASSPDSGLHDRDHEQDGDEDDHFGSEDTPPGMDVDFRYVTTAHDHNYDPEHNSNHGRDPDFRVDAPASPSGESTTSTAGSSSYGYLPSRNVDPVGGAREASEAHALLKDRVAPLSFGSVTAPLTSCSEGDGKCDKRHSEDDEGIQFPFHAMQVRWFSS
jgi:Zinc finger, C2H2 type